MADNVAAVAADDDFDVTADIAAAFDAAANDTPEPVEEPEVETAEQAAERARDEKGRFAAKTEKVDEPVPPEKVAAKAAAPVAPIVPSTVEPVEAVKPPPGFSPTAKVVWDKETLSKDEWEAVKRDIAKRNDEVGKGLAELTEYKPIKQYIEMARQSGTTLDKALASYVNIEQQISRDMVGGVAQIAQNKGVHPVALANQILARYGAAPSEGQTGEAPQARQQAPSADPATVQRIAALENILNQQTQATVHTELQRFASDPKHTFYENVKSEMGRLLNLGIADDLDDAYDKACWNNKEIRELLIKQQSPAGSDPSAKVAAATQARAASKSITGSPVPGAGNSGPSVSLEDEIRQLMDASV